MKHIEILIDNFLAFLKNPVPAALFKIVVIAAAAFLTVKIGSFIIDKLLSRRLILKDSKRVDTLAVLLSSVLGYVVYIAAAIVILSDVFGLTSILAAAGVGGIALGLGLQTLIKDVVSGFFLLVEDQYSVGDEITVDTMKGRVEELGFRLTKLRNADGDLYIIPNGDIRKLINHSRNARTREVGGNGR